MKFFSISLLLLCLCVSLVSCVDHQGYPPANPQQVRLKRDYTNYTGATIGSSNTSLTEYTYDGLGRYAGYSQFSQDRTGSTLSARSTVSYDSQGRLAQETINSFSSSDPVENYIYHYDAKGRVDSVFLNKILKISLAYDSQNRVIGQTYFSYRTTGEPLSISQDTYELDERGNIITRLQLFRYVPTNTSFRRQNKYVYDQRPNPYYGVPSALYRIVYGEKAYNSPNNIVSSTVMESEVLTGPFPSTAFSETNQNTLEFQDGLLVRSSSPLYGLVRNDRFEYEKY